MKSVACDLDSESFTEQKLHSYGSYIERNVNYRYPVISLLLLTISHNTEHFLLNNAIVSLTGNLFRLICILRHG